MQNLPLPSEFGNCRYFVGPGGSGDLGVFQVNIPDGAKWSAFTLVGCGGSGGQGRTRSAGVAGGGGGGGGGGAISSIFIPMTIWAPQTFYLYLAGPGSGWYSFLSTWSGVNSGVVATTPGPSSTAIIHAGSGTAASPGTAVAGGAGGAGGNGMTTEAIYTRLGIWSSIDGPPGAAGGGIAGANGGDAPFGANGVFNSGGGGGAGCTTTDFGGGGIAAGGLFPGLPGLPVAAGLDGSTGLYSLSEGGVYFTGGTGGASNNAGTAGVGGRGAPGCGGGGGGCGTAGSLGARGGPGFCLMSWG